MSSSNSRKADYSSSVAAAPMAQVDKLLVDAQITLTEARPAAPPPSKTPDDYWRELVVAEVKKEIPDEVMTLEDFLVRVGAASVEAEEGEEKDDVKPAQTVKRRAVALDPLEKAAQQRHRRMIKNRESAARSRERKQVPPNFVVLFARDKTKGASMNYYSLGGGGI